MKNNRLSGDEHNDWTAAREWHRSITGGQVAPTALDELENWAMQKPERTRMIMRLFHTNAVMTEFTQSVTGCWRLIKKPPG